MILVEQRPQAPDADAAAELALGKLHRRFVQQAAQQHRVEIGGEIDRDAGAVGPGQIRDALMAAVMGQRDLRECLDLLVKRVGHVVVPSSSPSGWFTKIMTPSSVM